MKCHIAKDLLPNYADGLNSEQTNAELKKHLDGCADCLAIYEKMTAEITQGVQTADKNVDFLKKLRSKILRKNVFVSAATCLLIIAALLIFAFNYQIPIPYDHYRMRAEIVPFAVIAGEDGEAAWTFVDDEMPADYEFIMDGLVLAYNGFSNISMSREGRDVNRNGETVRVVYYRYTKTPWVSMFFDYDLADYGASGMTSGTEVYGPSYGSLNYEPQMIEVYYLPSRDFSKLANLSDDDFDAQKVNGTLVWSGVI
jgi:hypothetical protein